MTTDARHGVKHAMTSNREHYGGVNYALAMAECADELEALLASRVGSPSEPTKDEAVQALAARVDADRVAAVRAFNAITREGARTLIGVPSEPTWQPMSSAPKDGTIIDVWLGNATDEEAEFYCTPHTRRSCGWHWHRERFRPVMGLTPVVTVTPTLWMPLPVLPPASEKDK